MPENCCYLVLSDLHRERRMAKRNDVAKWIIVAMAVAGLIFNSGILYNEVRHLKEDLAQVKYEVHEIRLSLAKR